MANETRIIDWALGNTSVLQLKATPLTRLAEWLPGYHDYLVRIEPFDRVYEGRGADQNEEIAFTKALVEALERLVKDRAGLATTSGLAGHSSTESASLSARLEVIERDAFLCHYLTRTPFYPISLAGFDKVPEFLQKATLCCATRGVRFEIRELRRIHDSYTVLAVAIGSSARPAFGVVLGCASGTSFLNALERAVVECVRNVVAVLDGNCQPPISCDEFMRLEHVGAEEQDRLARSVESAEVMLPYLDIPPPEALSHWADHSLELSDVSVEAIDFSRLVPELKSFPGAFVQARLEVLQPLFFGATRPESVNLRRLEKFIGHEISVAELQPYPHLFG